MREAAGVKPGETIVITSKLQSYGCALSTMKLRRIGGVRGKLHVL
jgi:hypothetical protein